jgi:hypothetical protein
LIFDVCFDIRWFFLLFWIQCDQHKGSVINFQPCIFIPTTI